MENRKSDLCKLKPVNVFGYEGITIAVHVDGCKRDGFIPEFEMHTILGPPLCVFLIGKVTSLKKILVAKTGIAVVILMMIGDAIASLKGMEFHVWQ